MNDEWEEFEQQLKALKPQSLSEDFVCRLSEASKPSACGLAYSAPFKIAAAILMILGGGLLIHSQCRAPERPLAEVRGDTYEPVLSRMAVVTIDRGTHDIDDNTFQHVDHLIVDVTEWQNQTGDRRIRVVRPRMQSAFLSEYVM